MLNDCLQSLNNVAHVPTCRKHKLITDYSVLITDLLLAQKNDYCLEWNLLVTSLAAL